MSAQDYPITFAYGAYDGVYYTAARPHKGNDRSTPSGTPVVIGGVVIGLTGNTGLTSGPHLHTQAGYDEWAQVAVKPDDWEFKPGVVVKTGQASQWGSYVAIKPEGGPTVFYCHLSEIYVQPNQTINKESDMISEHGLNVLYRLRLGRAPDKSAYASYVGKRTLEQVDAELQDSPEHKGLVEKAKTGDINLLYFAPSSVRQAYKAPVASQEAYEPVTETLYRKK